MSRLRVLLLFGGRSAEHDVSRVSAAEVARALDPSRYDVIPVAITTEGRWLLAAEARASLDAGPSSVPDAFRVEGTPVAQIPDPGHPTLTALGGSAGSGPGDLVDGIDVVLPLLHGPYGEDGTVQGLFELAGLPYVGTSVVGAAVAMDKVMMKRAFASADLPTASWLAWRDGHDLDQLCDRVEAELGLPCFVKPANLGSSVGVTKAHSRAELADAVRYASEFDEWVVVEETVLGREIEVGVLGDDPPETSVPGEVIPGDEFYSYADKYERDDAQIVVPASLTDAEIATVRDLARRAFESCRCEAMARVDFFLAPERGFVVNEVNTIPGFTPISMYPQLWAETGVAYPELLDRLIVLAIERHERRVRRAGRQRDPA